MWSRGVCCLRGQVTGCSQADCSVSHGRWQKEWKGPQLFILVNSEQVRSGGNQTEWVSSIFYLQRLPPTRQSIKNQSANWPMVETKGGTTLLLSGIWAQHCLLDLSLFLKTYLQRDDTHDCFSGLRQVFGTPTGRSFFGSCHAFCLITPARLQASIGRLHSCCLTLFYILKLLYLHQLHSLYFINR